MLCIRDIGAAAAQALCQRYELELEYLADDADIAGSFWGAPEAGILGRKVLVRPDTPVHSFLHETSHIICMDPQIRDEHEGNAQSDDLEEAAVCYLQVLLADTLTEVGSVALMRDMDEWGYSFRLGSTARWFTKDAEDAQAWLCRHGILSREGLLTGELRSA